jgi:small-conductance mechanosensitive channel
MVHYNKREKTANLLFKVVEYGLIAFGLNAILPNSPISWGTVLISGGIVLMTFILALIITPEKENKS